MFACSPTSSKDVIRKTIACLPCTFDARNLPTNQVCCLHLRILLPFVESPSSKPANPSILLSALITVMSYMELLTASPMLVTIDKAQGHLVCPPATVVSKHLCPQSYSHPASCRLIFETLFSDFKIPAGLTLTYPDLYCPCYASSMHALQKR